MIKNTLIAVIAVQGDSEPCGANQDERTFLNTMIFIRAVLEIVGELARREAASGEVRTFSPSLPKIVAAVYILGVLDRPLIIFYRDMRVVLVLLVCAFGVWGAPTTLAPTTVPTTDISPKKSSDLTSATTESNVTARATSVDKKIYPYSNQGFGLPYSGFQSPQGAFGDGYGLSPSFSPFPGNIYGQYPTGQNVFPQGLYSPQNQNPFYNQGSVQPAQVLGQPGQFPGTQGFQQNPLRPGQQGQLPQGLFTQGQFPQGPYLQGQYPPNQFPQQQIPQQNPFPQGRPAAPADNNNNSNGAATPQNPSDAGNDNTGADGTPAVAGGGEKEQQDGGPSGAQNSSDQTNRPNPSRDPEQLPGQGDGPAQLYPNQLQNPQGQGQIPRNPQGPFPQGAQSPQGGIFPQGGFPPGFQAGYPQGPQGGYALGPHGVFLPNSQNGFQGALPPGFERPPASQGPFPGNQSPENKTQILSSLRPLRPEESFPEMLPPTDPTRKTPSQPIRLRNPVRGASCDLHHKICIAILRLPEGQPQEKPDFHWTLLDPRLGDQIPEIKIEDKNSPNENTCNPMRARGPIRTKADAGYRILSE
ncbi:basic salivary proline-rich protein 1 [Galendromus occidentalis]|uniref:Basic salivary proline-rich protein 1 n=1 Tax=Galendromus occidentalis TaxID=34638 RepID=A0AAJ7SF69_9ACAR|nr:basic salivary proline-rich protein 1 [Galendromus occidentalis]